MKKLFTTFLCTLLLLSAFSCYTFGESTDFTVTIGKKTFNLDYVNNIDNIPEMKKIIGESNGTFYIETSKCYYYGKMSIVDDTIKVSDKIIKLDFSKEKFEGYDNSVENNNNISTKVKQALLGTTMEIQINKDMLGIKNSFYYQVYDNGKAISAKTNLEKATTVYSSKKIGDSIDIKLFDKKFNEIITVTNVTITKNYNEISTVTNATISKDPIVQKNISGTITLLDDKQHKNKGTNISVICSEFKNAGYSVAKVNNIYIPEGKTSAQYSFELGKDKNYIIGYKITDKETSFAPIGYYNKDGLVYQPDYADLLNLQDNDINNVNITINPSISIEGKIILPNDFKVPSRGLNVCIKTYTNKKSTTNELLQIINKDYIHIEKGKFSCEYKLNVNPNSNYIISYNITSTMKNLLLSSKIQKINITNENVKNIDIVFTKRYLNERSLNETSFIELTLYIPGKEKTTEGNPEITINPVNTIKNPIDKRSSIVYNNHKKQISLIKQGYTSIKCYFYFQKEYTYTVNFTTYDDSYNFKITPKEADKYILQFNMCNENKDVIKTIYYDSNGLISKLSE
jgi:hypothetical protein